VEPASADELHRAALDWAASVREDRAELAERLGSGELSLGHCLDAASSAPWGRTTVLFILESLPDARKSDTRRALSRLGVDGSLAVGELSPVQRQRLVAEFPLGFPGVRP
jgi:hypothetical protein